MRGECTNRVVECEIRYLQLWSCPFGDHYRKESYRNFKRWRRAYSYCLGNFMFSLCKTIDQRPQILRNGRSSTTRPLSCSRLEASCSSRGHVCPKATSHASCHGRGPPLPWDQLLSECSHQACSLPAGLSYSTTNRSINQSTTLQS